MMPGLQRVLATLSASETRLGDFVRGAAAATTALAPLSDELGPLIANSADTLGALDNARDPLGESIEEFPGTAGAAESALRTLARCWTTPRRSRASCARPPGPWARPRAA